MTERKIESPAKNSFLRACGLLGTQIECDCWGNTVSKAILCWKSSEVNQLHDTLAHLLRKENENLKIPSQWRQAFLLDIQPPTYMLVGFANLSADQLEAKRNSLTYDQGPALLSRSLF